MKKFLMFILILLFFAVAHADIYVATTGNDSGTGAIGSPLLTIQAGITALKVQGPGSTLYLRGGTYTTIPLQVINGNNVRCISFVTLNNATSYDNGYAIKSYPGEWAVIDAASYTDDRIYVFWGGDVDAGNGFITFERIEIKNAHSATHCAAINSRGGPYRFRYLSIHDNTCDTASNNPAGIELTNKTGHVTIEYCIFSHNGYTGVTNENSANVAMYSDYVLTWGSQVLDSLTNGFSLARHQNRIRYNIFNGGDGADKTSVGFKHKSMQYLENNVLFEGPIVDVNSWSDEYDELNHNIFINHQRNAVYWTGDFGQIHNNIVDASSATTYSPIQIGYTPRDDRPPSDVVVYNNTLKNGTRGGIYWAHHTEDPTVYYERYYTYNNIIDSCVDASGYRDVTFKLIYGATTWDADTLNVFNNNYLYDPDNDIVAKVLTVDLTLIQLNATTWAESNYSHAHSDLDSLYTGTTGADQYILRPGYSDYSTVSAGGYGAAHPYLSGVTIPAYIGAVNPADSGWVAGVLAMDTTFFTTATGDPTWIEGAVPSPYTSPVVLITTPSQSTTAELITILGTFETDPALTASGVSVNGVPATSSDGFATWAATDVPLSLGSNTITATGTDSAAQVDTDSITVTRENVVTNAQATGVTLQGVQWNQ